MVDIKGFINDSKNVKRFAFMTLALFLAAVTFNLFISPINLVAGGAVGVSIIFREAFGFDASLVIFLISFICFVFSLLFLDSKNSIAALFSSLVYPLFIKVTSGIENIFLIDSSNVLLLVLFSGLLGGISQGIIYKQGLNNGGLNVISRIFFKYFNISIAKVNFIINFVIVVFGVCFFGFNMLLYAFLYLFISKYVSEKIMLGVSRNKAFYIISDKYKEIVLVLNKELGHDATIYNVKGKFNDEKRKMIMTIIPNSEYYVAKEMIGIIDPSSFIFVCDSYEVLGQDIKLKEDL